MNVKYFNKTKEIIKLKLEKNKSIIHVLKNFKVSEEDIVINKDSYLVYSNLSYIKNNDKDNVNFYYLNDEDGGIVTLSLLEIIAGIISKKIEIVYVKNLKKDTEIENFIKKIT